MRCGEKWFAYGFLLQQEIRVVFREMLMRAMLEMQERVYVWSGGVGVCDPSLLFLLEVIYRECNERDHDGTEVDKEEFAACCGIRVDWVVCPSDGCGLRVGLWVTLLEISQGAC